MLLIANAYGGGKRSKWVHTLYRRHYITLWGYDERKQIFFIYDSNTKKRIFPDMPIGNSYLTYKELVRYRSIGATRMVRSYGISIWYR